ncbi:type II toxin-antitoxin system HicA family toxin [Paenibacillus provencensis]|uniref:Type II toxin-antitoxin system HicA family toxin n=1 Tax=Paenibacillus provencensis TaxID=441151 RepID=A0ABW3PWE6_9BACL|nr:type II toxin-antitoxin system HicA family toxin [Paenibacillus sp. MER 78]MCM3128999.1 type II toxin-antitoxin system HicA family toxin [Paenibacillus sp. MER 78]
MARVEKLVQKMKNRPNGMRFEEVVKVLEHYGYIVVRIKGSHHIFRNEQGDTFPIPKETPVKTAYVKDVLEKIGE